MLTDVLVTKTLSKKSVVSWTPNILVVLFLCVSVLKTTKVKKKTTNHFNYKRTRIHKIKYSVHVNIKKKKN
jgi:choline-glycine betaine transporter